jgi:hypothetical protein
MEGPPEEEDRAERAQITLCLFPNLKEFIVVDGRGDAPRIILMQTGDVFDEETFKEAEEGVSKLVRRQADMPLSYLMAIPEQVEDLLRALAIEAILQKIGEKGDPELPPRIAVLMVTGAALHMDREQMLQSFHTVIAEDAPQTAVQEWADAMERLIQQEKQALRRVEQEELRDALDGHSERFYTLWENRN